MILYTTQALFLGALLLCATRSSRRADSFLTAYVCVWTVGVIFLYWRFRTAQDTFYSDDQIVQVDLVEHVSQNPLVYSLQGIVGLRYVITIPASLLTRMGIDTLLALKFLQALFFVLTYRLVREHFRIEKLKFKTWYVALFAGPLLVFMSLLGLRDLALAYFALNLLIGRDVRMYAISWIGLFFLRPHLAVAILFGWFVGFVFSRVRVNFSPLFIPLIVVVSFVFGTYAYIIGRHFQVSGPLDFNSVSHLWSQSAFIRLFANFGGLQFLLFSSEVVNLSIQKLFLLRILFFDTFLIPILFLWTLISTPKLQRQSVSIFAAFAFFLGLVSVTDYNSSRQNIPFLVLMGVIVATHLANRDRRSSFASPADLSQNRFPATRTFSGS